MSKLARAWHRNPAWLWLLWPLSLVFALVSALRRALYRAGILPSGKPPAFVIVVGNISVGGNGKTPLVVALAEWFTARNVRVGVLSRGYGGQIKQHPHVVSASDPASDVGDEPRLMAARTGLPVVIDPVRRRGAEYLNQRLNCEVILCDDGLQHYGLKRDMELVVMDERRYGNGRLLPMGPLREGVWRLDTVDLIVHNVKDFQQARLLSVKVPQYAMQLQPEELVNVVEPGKRLSIEEFNRRYKTCSAIAGIGNPGRFFRQLSTLGMTVAYTRPFDDHHPFVPEDIPDGAVVMTEKDAVKMAGFAHPDCWYLPVKAVLDGDFFHQIRDQFKEFKKRIEG